MTSAIVEIRCPKKSRTFRNVFSFALLKDYEGAPYAYVEIENQVSRKHGVRAKITLACY